MILEVCVDNIDSALNATGGGAKRIELCNALYLGGLTPSLGLFKTAKRLLPSDCQIFVMIRPKSGSDFVYTSSEIDIMIEDIKIFKDHGANGFVFGCLTREKTVDVDACTRLLNCADTLPCTFHRAFDEVSNAEESLLTLINLGFSRILTSGGKPTAYLGKNLIKQLVSRVKELNSELIIVAGGGIDLSNLGEILKTTQVREFHGSARCDLTKAHDMTIYLTDESVVKEMIQIANTLVL